MKYIIIILLFTLTLACSQQKQVHESGSDIAHLIEVQNYIFRVRTILPTGGRAIQATTQYDVRVSKDSLVSYLPYFGRAYSAPIGTGDAGLQFTSTDFAYISEPRKKGGWLIRIKPNDNRDIQQMFLTVAESGSASLQVKNTKPPPTSYNGNIEKAASNH